MDSRMRGSDESADCTEVTDREPRFCRSQFPYSGAALAAILYEILSRPAVTRAARQREMRMTMQMETAGCVRCFEITQVDAEER